jgi:hypothetical protein
LITKEEVHVLQEVIAKQCALIVPDTVAEAALYAVENRWLRQIEESIIKGSEGSPCGLANPVGATESSLTGAAAASQKCQRPHSRRGNGMPERQHRRAKCAAASDAQ